MKNFEKQLKQFWQIKSITNRDGSPKQNRKEMYETWTSDKNYIFGLRPQYYGTRFTLRWDSLLVCLWGIEERHKCGTSYVEKIEDTKEGFKVYTINSIYEFIKIDINLNDILDKVGRNEEK